MTTAPHIQRSQEHRWKVKQGEYSPFPIIIRGVSHLLLRFAQLASSVASQGAGGRRGWRASKSEETLQIDCVSSVKGGAAALLGQKGCAVVTIVQKKCGTCIECYQLLLRVTNMINPHLIEFVILILIFPQSNESCRWLWGEAALSLMPASVFTLLCVWLQGELRIKFVLFAQRRKTVHSHSVWNWFFFFSSSLSALTGQRRHIITQDECRIYRSRATGSCPGERLYSCR